MSSREDALLFNRWQRAADDLGLELDEAFELRLGSGATVQCALRVRHFGAEHGMLLLTTYDVVEPLVDELIEAGYGFSVLSGPAEGETYVRDEFVDVLADWGWSGAPAERPTWLPRGTTP